MLQQYGFYFPRLTDPATCIAVCAYVLRDQDFSIFSTNGVMF
jgi:hypothetical protein